MSCGIKPLFNEDEIKDSKSISRDYKIIFFFERYYTVIGVKLAMSRAAANEVISLVLKSTNSTLKNNSSVRNIFLNIPTDPYSISTIDKESEQKGND